MKKGTFATRFLAEWHPQSAVMLAWPHEGTDWQPLLQEVIPCYVQIVKEIVRWEKVIIIGPSAQAAAAALGESANGGRVAFLELPSNDTWIRDYGPISMLVNGRPAVYDFTFNGWGLKFPANHDNQINRRMYKNLAYAPTVDYYSFPDMVLEGGSLECDGQGTLLTTARCLLSSNRNDYQDTDKAEDILKTVLGLRRVLWLHHGWLVGDDTDGHIDTLARFCDAETIAYVRCTDTDDEHFTELSLMEQELQSFRTPDGHPYRLISLPMAAAVYDDGQRLPATYTNFLIINGAVLMPTYDSPSDETARTALQTAFPDRKVIGINCLPLIKQHGSLHCATMQLPREFIS
jgi:agmatine/peptidylarginine deiminase